MTSSFNPCVSISSSDNLVREMLQILLGCFIIESSSDKSLTGKNCIFWISYGLYFIINNHKYIVATKCDKQAQQSVQSKLQCLIGIDTYLSLSWNTNESLVVVGKSDGRWSGSLTCRKKKGLVSQNVFDGTYLQRSQ